MNFYSTNSQDQKVDFITAVRKGLAEDRGLYMPDSIPVLPGEFFKQLPNLSLSEIAVTILSPFVNSAIKKDELRAICEEAFSFDLPLTKLSESIYALELFHGPTLAFKDFGARFMARILGHINAASETKNVILVATSGDTGSAVASGFYKVPNVEVVILYPKGKVSKLQEQQMTTLGENIIAVAIEGNFDDCQRLVKTAFLDKEIAGPMGLTSANSINLARLLPQMIYYFYAYGQLAVLRKPMVFSVPSGNYGNLTAGVLASRMGLAIDHFIAASNANNIVPEYLRTGLFEPKPSIETISNAMDVGDPSNFVRLDHLFGHSHGSFKSAISGYNYTDEETRTAIGRIYKLTGNVADPHGAIGFLALEEYRREHDVTGVFLETAHPIKFRDNVEPIIEFTLDIPEQLQPILEKDRHSHACSAGYEEFKSLLKRLL